MLLTGCGSSPSTPTTGNSGSVQGTITLAPTSSYPGKTLSVAITGLNTGFLQGQTQATFGAGIAVNGAASGLPGLITVTSTTAATANLVLDATAAAGTRDITVTTGTQTATLKAGFTVLAPLLPLIVNSGGPYTGFTGRTVQFNGSQSSDPNGQTLAYAWNFGDGGTAATAQPTHTYTRAGTFTVQLTVSDPAGLTAVATTTATITTLGNPIAIAGGPYAGTPGQAVAFDAGASTDPNGSALTYAWTFGDGATATGPKPTHAYATAGAYTAMVTVTDTYSLTATAAAAVTIAAAVQAPKAVAGGPYSGLTGTPIAFNGSASTDPQNQALAYTWDFGDGATATGAQPTHAYTIAAAYTARLTVTNTSGLTSTATAAVTVTAPSILTANPGGPYTGTLAAAIPFSGAASFDPKRETLTYAWDFGDSTTATGVSPTHLYTNLGTYTVTLTVTNTDAATATATTTVTIAGILQAIQTGPATGNVGQSLSFSAAPSTAPGSDVLRYAWTFGDGATDTGVQVAHTYTASGTYTVTLIATDTTTNATSTKTATVAITQPPAIAFNTPTQGALFNTTTIAVTGTAATSVQTLTVNGVAAALSSGAFSATIPVREGVNILTASGTDASGNTGTASTSVTVDLTPPLISILEPAEGSTAITQQIAVSGMVSDQVTGTVNASDVTLTINGQPAQVANRSFLLSGLILVPGLNTLNLVATDRAGNTARSTLHVTLANATAQQHIVILSGDAQSGQIGAVLPHALAVQLVSATGSPIPNRAVTFTVTASDGVVESLPQQAQTLTLMTDAQGKSSVLFQLGSRAGLGINQVSVTSPGFMGSAVFNETTTAGTPTYIHEFMGNNQRGIIGQPLAQAFQVIVQDSGGDPIAGVPVTFTVNTGDATFSGQPTTTATTNGDGRATALLTLGQQEGVNNNTVTADFAADPNAAVNFYASGYSQGAAANTSVSGVVLDDSGNPVPNATARLLNTTLSTTTDANGHFSIPGAPVGTVTLLVDGSTTTLSETLPSLSFLLQDLPGQNNTLNMPVYLPIIDTQSARTAGGSTPATLSLASMPGVALTVAPNSVTFPDGSHVGQITLSQVKNDLVPMPPPNGAPPLFAWTIQPAGTKFSTPVTITIPNTGGLPPGMVQEGYQYDHDLEQFVSVGTLRVSPDGSVLNSDPGFGITKAGWAGFPPNPGPGSCGQSCNDNNVCTTDTQDSKTCLCKHTPKGGACNTNPGAGRNNCQTPGMCKDGACQSKPKPFGSSCDDGAFCTENDQCGIDGACRGTMKPDMNNGSFSGASIQGNLDAFTRIIQSFLRPYFGAAGDSFQATFSMMGQTKTVCCENLKKNVKDSSSTFSAMGGISTQKFFLNFPPWSINFPGGGGGYGLFASFGISIGGSVKFDDTMCAQMKCINGSITTQGTVDIGLGVQVNDPVNGSNLLAIGAKGSTGLNVTIQPTGDCHGVMGSIGINALNLTTYFQYDNGQQYEGPVATPIQAYTITDGSFSLP